MKEKDFHTYKANLANMDQVISKQKMENKLIEIHQKEKEKELSLVELKIKEL